MDRIYKDNFNKKIFIKKWKILDRGCKCDYEGWYKW